MTTTTQGQRNVVEDDANWTIRIRKEQSQSKHFANEWGFLVSSEYRNLSRSVSPVKYHDRGSSTIKSIRVPEKVVKTQLPTLSRERLGERPLRPKTAMESVVMSNVLRAEFLTKVNPFFVTTSTTYGSRLPLEQFGVSQHGVRATRSKLPSN